ncbi:MAG: hypothetical protein E6R03_06395 [Hyphomicrobiaceae bacterium]|nr:MAG: hypothetical protein E6R03_06395 [Hyphomicrobiaceae bacterium]
MASTPKRITRPSNRWRWPSMAELKIDPEFRDLIPPLSADEYAGLEKNIKAHGCRKALDVWNGILVDGHNRFKICTEHNIPYKVDTITFEDRSAAKLWILDNQFDRRNLDVWTRAELASVYEDVVAAMAKERQGKRNDLNIVEKLPQCPPVPKTRDVVAAKAGISGRTYDKFKTIKEKATPKLIEAVKTGEVSISAAAEICSLSKQEQSRVVEYEKDRIPHIARAIRNDRVTVAHVSHNSGENEWYTPPEFIEAARATMGSIDCDPASCKVANETVKAGVYYDAKADGLKQTWRGNVWMNPPYAQPLIAQFSSAVAEKYKAGEVDQAVVLVNNATETEWFQTMLAEASAVCFPKSRIRFLDKVGNPIGAPLQGQAILYLGPNVDAFVMVFAKFGVICWRDSA